MKQSTLKFIIAILLIFIGMLVSIISDISNLIDFSPILYGFSGAFAHSSDISRRYNK